MNPLNPIHPAQPDSGPLGRAQEPEHLHINEAIDATTPAEIATVVAVRQVMSPLLRAPVVEAAAIMPDCCPTGREPGTLPVGGVIAARNAIIPACHSSDVCCSMYATFFHPKENVARLLDILMDVTRFGSGGRLDHELVHHPVIDEPVWDNPFLNGLQSYAIRHMADQGDGNHFAYIGRVSHASALAAKLADKNHVSIASQLHGVEEAWVLVTHHGSRGLGANLYKRGIDAAIRNTKMVAKNIPPAASWLDYNTKEGRDYWAALEYVGRWTRGNHEAIHNLFMKSAHLVPITSFGNEHNFVWRRGEIFVHGKGATPAWLDAAGVPLLGMVPLNMAAPILIVSGADNKTFLSFSPHGAGRNLSRTETKKAFRDDTGNLMETKVRKSLASQTAGLDIRWFCGRPDISESPMGYKSPESIIQQIEKFRLANVIGAIEPMGCIMAGDSPRPGEHSRMSKKQFRTMGHRADRRANKASLRNLDYD